MTRDEAVEIAAKTAQEEGWPWKLPIYAARHRRGVLFGRKYWEIKSNAATRGQNATILVDDETGNIEAKHFLPR